MEEIAERIEALTLSDAIARSKNELTLSDAIARSKNEMLSNFSEAAQEVQFQPQELVEQRKSRKTLEGSNNIC